MPSRRTAPETRPLKLRAAVEYSNVVQPRKPPAKTLRPEGSLRLTHQLKFSINAWNDRSRKRRSDRPSTRSIL